MKKFVALARVSSREQEREGFSLDVQVDAINTYASLDGGEVTKLFRVAETATKQHERKVFKELLRYMRKNAEEIDGLLVYKVDRAVRNLVDLVQLESIEEEHKIPLIPVSQPTDKTPAGRMMRRFLAMIAAFQTEQQSIDVKEGLARRVSEGLFPQKAPFGYENYRVEGRSLVRLHPENGRKVQRIFQLYAFHGHTVDSLVEQLADEGITYQPSKPRFPRTTLHTLLRNRAYIGEIGFRGEWRPGVHEPLVDLETWNRVQHLLGEGVYQSVEKTFAGELIECGCCGRTITGETVKGRYCYYRCTRYTKDDHPRIRMREEDLDQQVLGLFDQLAVNDEEVREWLIRVRYEKENAGQEYLQRRRVDLQRQMTAAINQQKRLVLMRLNDEIDEQTMRDQKAELGDRVSQLKGTIDEIDLTLVAAKDYFDPRVFSQRLRNCWAVADVGVKRRILNGLFNKCRLVGRTLIPEWRQPFDVITKTA